MYEFDENIIPNGFVITEKKKSVQIFGGGGVLCILIKRMTRLKNDAFCRYKFAPKPYAEKGFFNSAVMMLINQNLILSRLTKLR